MSVPPQGPHAFPPAGSPEPTAHPHQGFVPPAITPPQGGLPGNVQPAYGQVPSGQPGYGQGLNQPGYGQGDLGQHGVAPYGQLPPGEVHVHIQGSVFTSSIITPTLLLNGYQVASRYGDNGFQVPAGTHRVELFAQWMRRYGQALLDVQVPPGGRVDVFYAAPWHQFTTGSIGFQKQSRKGTWLIVALAAFLLLFCVIIPAALVLGS